MGVWNTATPAGTDPKSQGDDRIRELKSAIEEALQGGGVEGDEAIFPGENPLTAPIFRYRGLRGSTAARPDSGEGGLYYNTDTGTLQRDNGTPGETPDPDNWEDVTENAAYEAIHAADSISLASALGVVTLTEAGNAFHVSGTEAVAQIAGWTHGIVTIRWTQARTLTYHASNLILFLGVDQVVAAGDITVFQFIGEDKVREIGRLSGYGVGKAPTRQVLTSGTTATYTTPAGARQLKIRMVGGGGGGAAQSTNAGTVGSDTSFNSIVATGGGAGQVAASNPAGAAGGTGGAGTADIRLQGGGSGGRLSGGFGGNTVFGGGAPGTAPTGDGAAGYVNTGGGGGGGSSSSVMSAGGGGGEYVEFTISNPSATYTYTVGGGGAGGAAGAQAGGAGGSGVIIVDEIY